VGTAASRAKAVQSAAVLFQRQGYAATGVAQVIEESGTPKGSFYFNFPEGKEELGREALTFAGGQLGAGIDQLAASAPTPRRFLRSLTAALGASLETSDFSRGCPVATVALETATTSESLRRTAERQFAAWEDSIARGLAGGAHPRQRDRELAGEILILIEGALIMARVRRTTAPLRDLDRTFARLLRR
jgi:TetR/AcrR family transcriptional repressor of lmrAB and yxaGH operons